MWHLLRNPLDWERHQQDTAKQSGATGTLINWGLGPQSYPCLVASYAASPLKIVSAYVYCDDAAQLLQAKQVTDTPIEPTTAVALPVGDDRIPEGNRQGDHNKAVSAHLLAIVYFMTETGICSRERYDAKYTEALSCVDEWSAEERDKLLDQLKTLKSALGTDET